MCEMLRSQSLLKLLYFCALWQLFETSAAIAINA